MYNSQPKLQRSFSSSNLHATERIHEYVSKQERHQGNTPDLKREVTKSSMIIPTFGSMRDYHPDLPVFLLKLLVNIGTLKAIEQARLVNWCRAARSLVPLNTTADGNCLLHSISMYVFGVHDRQLNLRRFIYRKLMAENRFTGQIYTRWKAEQELALHEVQTDFNSGEMRTDWDSVVQAACPKPFPYGNQGPPLQSLEDIHVFTASNILARPIIVICDRMHRSLDGRSFQPSRMGGIYLPLLRNPSECEKTPIVLCYWQNHFMPLLNAEDFDLVVTAKKDHPDSQLCIPLVYEDLSRMPVRFLLGSDIQEDLVHAYLDCMDIPLYGGEGMQNLNHVSAAILKFKPPPAWSVELMWSLFSLAREMFNESLSKPTSPSGDRSDRSPVLPRAGCLPGQPVRQQGEVMPKITRSQSSQSPLMSPTYSQPSGPPTPKHNDVLPHASELCKGNGTKKCTNLAANPLYGLCDQCYKEFMEPVVKSEQQQQHLYSRYDTPPKQFLQPVSPIEFPSSGRLETTEVMMQPRYRDNRTIQKCLKTSCPNPGLDFFEGLCRSCYDEKMSGSPIGDMTAPFDEKMNAATCRRKSDVPPVEASKQLVRRVPSNESRTDPMYQYRKEMMYDPVRSEACAPTRMEDRNTRRNEPRDNSRVTAATIVEPSRVAMPQRVKTLCADPGCQEQPVAGSQLCQSCMDRGKADCMTEGCRNKATDREVPLCEKCRKEQMDVVSKREDPVKKRPPEKPETSVFEAPHVYPSFDKPNHVIQASSLYDDPHRPELTWQQAYHRNGSSTALHPMCRESACNHRAAADKEGLCNECFMSKTILENRKRQTIERKCLAPGCHGIVKDDFGSLCEACYKQMAREPLAGLSSSGKLLDHVAAPTTTWQYEQDFPEMSRPGRLSASSGHEIASTYRSTTSDTYAEPSPLRYAMATGVSNVPPPLPPARIIPPSGAVPSGVTAPGVKHVYINEGYEQGLYSLQPPATSRCIMAGCGNEANEKLNGLCDRCYQQSVKQEELLRTKKERQAVHAQMQPPAKPSKLPSDSPYLNPVPCKTLGCPHTGIREHGFMCIICHGKAIDRANRTLANREPPAYEGVGGGAIELGSRQQPQPEPIYDEPRIHQEIDVGQRQPSQECSTPGCTFFASPEYGSLCSKCFLEKTKSDVIRPKQDSPGEKQQVPRRSDELYYLQRGPLYTASSMASTSDVGLYGLLGNQPCRKPGCNMYGRTEQGGYCSKCYNEPIM